MATSTGEFDTVLRSRILMLEAELLHAWLSLRHDHEIRRDLCDVVCLRTHTYIYILYAFVPMYV